MEFVPLLPTIVCFGWRTLEMQTVTATHLDELASGAARANVTPGISLVRLSTSAWLMLCRSWIFTPSETLSASVLPLLPAHLNHQLLRLLRFRPFRALQRPYRTLIPLFPHRRPLHLLGRAGGVSTCIIPELRLIFLAFSELVGFSHHIPYHLDRPGLPRHSILGRWIVWRE